MDTSRLLFRVALLALLVAGWNLWTVHHVGIRVTELAAVNAFALALGALLGLLTPEEAEAARGLRRRLLLGLISPPVLFSLLALSLIASSLVSSVRVLADGAPDTRLYLTPEGQPRDASSARELDGPTGIARYVRLTTPFGRPFYLEAKGYQRHSFDLHPWTGETIRVSADLTRLPSVLLRLPPSALSKLAGGRLRIRTNGSEWAEIPTEPGRGSVMLGTRTPIPARLLQDWRDELRAVHAPGEQGETLRHRIFVQWKSPLVPDHVQAVPPGTALDAEMVSGGGNVVAQTRVTVGRDAFQDLSLRELP
jgi:hypothetical protein